MVLAALFVLGVLLMPTVWSAPKNEAMAACIGRLRPSLRPLDLASFVPPSADETAFLAFYGLDLPGARHWLGTLELAEHRIAVHVYEPPAPAATVLIAHGYYDHAGVWNHVLGPLVTAGYRVVIYDQPGHGLSDGEPAAIDDFQTYVRVLDGMVGFAAAAFPGDLHLVAHSMGAGVVADWLLQGNGEGVGRVVLLAPLFHSSAWGVSRFGHAVVGRWFHAMPRKYRRNSGDAQFLAFVRADPLQHDALPASWVSALGRWNRQVVAREPSPRSVLVLQGDRDTTVAWRHNLRLLARLFPNAEVRLIEAGQHQLMNEALPLRDQVVRQILDGLQPVAGAPPPPGGPAR